MIDKLLLKIERKKTTNRKKTHNKIDPSRIKWKVSNKMNECLLVRVFLKWKISLELTKWLMISIWNAFKLAHNIKVWCISISIVVLSRLSLKCFENTSAAKVNICQLYFTSNGLRFIISIYLFIISFGAVCVCCPLVSFRYYVCVHTTTYLSGNNRFLYFIIIDILFGNLELSVPMRQQYIRNILTRACWFSMNEFCVENANGLFVWHYMTHFNLLRRQHLNISILSTQ